MHEKSVAVLLFFGVMALVNFFLAWRMHRHAEAHHDHLESRMALIVAVISLVTMIVGIILLFAR